MLKKLSDIFHIKTHLIYKNGKRKEIEILEKSSFFDADWYENKYGIKSCEAIEHYLNIGCSLGYDPSFNFSTTTYYSLNPDTKIMNALLHYEMYGKSEGRRINFIDDNGYRKPEVCFTNYTIYEQYPKKMVFEYYENPLVSIVIPVFNKYDFTMKCLYSILQNTKGISYEIILADDGSDDETKFIKNNVSNIKVTINNGLHGFVPNCINACKNTSGKYILLLNNDTQVQENWLENLIQIIDKDENIGLVGPKFIYPDGILQEAGGIVFNDANVMNFGRRDNPDLIKYNYLRECDYISGACILFRKTDYEKVGGLDDIYSPAYYEDTDLALKIRHLLNKKIMYVPTSVVVHFEGVSNGNDLTTGLKKYQEVNKDKFYKKWHHVLKDEYGDKNNFNFLLRDHALNKDSILVIDWKILSFTKDTGSRATYQYMKFFHKNGLNVKYYPHDWYIEDNYLQDHLLDGFEVIKQDFEAYIKENGCHFKYIFLNRPDIAKNYIELLRKYTNAKIIYQCHDLHYLRQYRTRQLNDLDLANKMYDIEKDEEFKVFRSVDLCCSFSFDEINIINKEDPSIKTKQLPLYILDSKKMDSYSYKANKRKNLMFVAGFQHNPNIDGALWFVNKIFPLIKQYYPDIRLTLCGSNPTKEIQELASESIDVTGYVSEDRLEELYKEHRLVIVPLRSGAGVKGKIIESIYHLVPVITTSIGIEGIDNSEENIIVVDSEKEIAQKIISVYNDYEFLNNMSKKSKDFIKKYYSEECVKKALSSFIDF